MKFWIYSALIVIFCTSIGLNIYLLSKKPLPPIVQIKEINKLLPVKIYVPGQFVPGTVDITCDEAILELNKYRMEDFITNQEGEFLKISLVDRYIKLKISNPTEVNYNMVRLSYYLLNNKVSIGYYRRFFNQLPLYLGLEVDYYIQKSFDIGIAGQFSF